MRRVPRRPLAPEFVLAVRDADRSLCKLAMLADFATPSQLIDQLNAKDVRASALNVERFQKLAGIVNYTGSIFVEAAR
jgi:hypothetical protein